MRKLRYIVLLGGICISVLLVRINVTKIASIQVSEVTMHTAKYAMQQLEGLKQGALKEQVLLEVQTPKQEVDVKDYENDNAKDKIEIVNTKNKKKKSKKTKATKKKVKNKIEFEFPDNVSKCAQEYLTSAYEQVWEVCKDTSYPDPFMAMSLSVVEQPVSNSEVFRIPLVYQSTLDTVLKQNDGDYSVAIQYSSKARDYKKYACVGPLQMASGWVSCTKRNPTIWKDSCQMFYEDAELAVPGMTKFAEKCGIEVTDSLLRSLIAMRHNVGYLSDWANSSPTSRTGHSYIPFKNKGAVFEWNAAVASDEAQYAIKESAYQAYVKYLKTGIYENSGIGWEDVADITGYDKRNITSTKEWWRPLYSVRFWFNYYQLRLLYGVDTVESLGIRKIRMEELCVK